MEIAYLHVVRQITQDLILQGDVALAVLVSVECHNPFPHSITDVIGVERVLHDNRRRCGTCKLRSDS